LREVKLLFKLLFSKLFKKHPLTKTSRGACGHGKIGFCEQVVNIMGIGCEEMRFSPAKSDFFTWQSGQNIQRSLIPPPRETIPRGAPLRHAHKQTS
jgi:hypothetical protein